MLEDSLGDHLTLEREIGSSERIIALTKAVAATRLASRASSYQDRDIAPGPTSMLTTILRGACASEAATLTGPPNQGLTIRLMYREFPRLCRISANLFIVLAA